VLYFWLKIIHVISASILFGTGMGTAFYMLLANRTKNIKLISIATSHVVKADWLFTSTSGVVQALTGFTMIYLHGYSLYQLWIFGSILGYLIAGLCWVPVVYLQIKLHEMAKYAYENSQGLPQKYYQYYRYWFILGWPAFISLIIVYYLMTAKP